MTSTLLHSWRRLGLVVLLLLGGIAMWLSAAPAGHATSVNQTQPLSATVVSALSWGTAGSCTQAMGAADLGNLQAGVLSSQAPQLYTGCVSSPGLLTVSVVMTTPPTANSVPFPPTGIGIFGTYPSGGGTCTSAGLTCSLNQSRTLFTGAPAGVSTFRYSYSAMPPSGFPSGNYTGGEVTFTATA